MEMTILMRHFNNIDVISQILQVNENEVTKINGMSQTLQMDEIEVTKIDGMSQTLQMDEIDNVEWFTIWMKH